MNADYCTLILLGRVIILAGKDKFRADAGAWKVLGTDALLSDVYEPDYSAFANPEKRSNEGGSNKVRACESQKFSQEYLAPPAPLRMLTIQPPMQLVSLVAGQVP